MIFLVHHADAVGPDVDPQRPLSLAGRMHADLLAQHALARGVKPVAIWHSGKLRARMTAEAFWRTCNPMAEFKAIRGLQPSDPAVWTRDLVAGETRDLMLVGHMPSLPQIFRLLVTGAADGAAEFPPHGLIALEPEGAGWREAWRLAR
jgi:phosphohistidine phosphatase